MKPRLLMAHPHVHPSGGGNAVAAWALEALRHDYDVTLAALSPVDCAAVNRSFGTTLKPGDFRLALAPPGYRALLRGMPTQGALLQCCVMMRWAAALARRERFDVLLSSQNEADFHQPGLQYVHYPWYYMPRPEQELRWFHRLPGFLRVYRAFCIRLAGCTPEGLRRNTMLANSGFVADRIRQAHGVESIVLPPPVPGGFPDVPWEERRLALVGVGRIHEHKRWHHAVEAVDLVRARGHALELTLIGHRDGSAYAERLAALARPRPWMRLLHDLSRAELLAEVARHRYGIHPMEEEHFGIAPAEIQRAGCLIFVHRSGGPMEIVGHEERLMFSTPAEAAQRICAAIEDPGTEASLRAHAARRREVYSAEGFCEGLRAEVAAQLARR